MPENHSFLIVEDELLIAEMIAEILLDAGYNDIRQAISVEGALREINSKTPSLVLTDIALGREKTGIDLGQQLQTQYHIPFIYISSHSSPEILGKAKHTRPNAYIVKPFKPEDLLVAIEFALFNSSNSQMAHTDAADKDKEEEDLTVKEGRTIVKLNCSDIVMLEAEGNYTSITLNNNKRRVVRNPISEFENQLNGRTFVRIHKSYIVNQTYVTEVNPSTLLVNGRELPIGRTYQTVVSERLYK